MNKLCIYNQTPFVFKYRKKFELILQLICEEEKLQKSSEVSLIIINNQEMQNLSLKYRNINKTTDVLSFPTNYKKLQLKLGYNMLGDIYMSYQKIELQAKTYNHLAIREWSYIFAHSIYHLLGFNHQNDVETKIMNSKVANIMNKIGIKRNA